MPATLQERIDANPPIAALIKAANIDMRVLEFLSSSQFVIAPDFSTSNTWKDTSDGQPRIFQLREGFGVLGKLIFFLDPDSKVPVIPWADYPFEQKVANSAQELNELLNPEKMLQQCDGRTNLASVLDLICEQSMESATRRAVLVPTDGQPDDLDAAVNVLVKWCSRPDFLIPAGKDGALVPRVRFLFLGYGSNKPTVIQEVEENLSALDDRAQEQTGHDPAGHAFLRDNTIAGVGTMLLEWAVG